MVALLRAGVIHRICNQPVTEKAKRDFIILMAHLFGRRRLPRAYTTQENIKQLVKRSPSIVILPSLPQDARDVLLNHDRELLKVFQTYALTYAHQRRERLGPDEGLPLSGKAFSHEASNTTTSFLQHLRQEARRSIARSPFVATSGHVDDFESVEDLVKTARRGLHLNKHAIPLTTHLTAEAKDPLNAYLLDFYMHGQTAALEKANGIRRGEVWYLLQDFDLTLMTVRGVIEDLITQASTHSAKAQEEALNEHKDDGEDEAIYSDSGYATGTVVSVDPIEADEGLAGDDSPELNRPKNVTDKDWRVYTVIDAALKEFNAKYKAMWA